MLCLQITYYFVSVHFFYQDVSCFYYNLFFFLSLIFHSHCLIRMLTTNVNELMIFGIIKEIVRPILVITTADEVCKFSVETHVMICLSEDIYTFVISRMINSLGILCICYMFGYLVNISHISCSFLFKFVTVDYLFIGNTICWILIPPYYIIVFNVENKKSMLCSMLKSQSFKSIFH